MTLHRPANVDDMSTLSALMAALDELAGELPIVFPVHPRTRNRLKELGYDGKVRIVDPLGYLAFLALQADAALVLTDSGGIQEETTVLGVPCLTLRANTERPITITEGTNQLVGRDPDRIVRTARSVLADGIESRRPALWDGRAAERIADVLLSGGTAATRLRPTSLP